MKSRNIILSLALMGCTATNALTLQQAKKLYSEGEFGKALSTFQGLVKKIPATHPTTNGTVPAFMKPVARLKPENISRLPTTNA